MEKAKFAVTRVSALGNLKFLNTKTHEWVATPSEACHWESEEAARSFMVGIPHIRLARVTPTTLVEFV